MGILPEGQHTDSATAHKYPGMRKVHARLGDRTKSNLGELCNHQRVSSEIQMKHCYPRMHGRGRGTVGGRSSMQMYVRGICYKSSRCSRASSGLSAGSRLSVGFRLSAVFRLLQAPDPAGLRLSSGALYVSVSAGFFNFSADSSISQIWFSAGGPRLSRGSGLSKGSRLLEDSGFSEGSSSQVSGLLQTPCSVGPEFSAVLWFWNLYRFWAFSWLWSLQAGSSLQTPGYLGLSSVSPTLFRKTIKESWNYMLLAAWFAPVLI